MPLPDIAALVRATTLKAQLGARHSKLPISRAATSMKVSSLQFSDLTLCSAMT
jgi:hypothetical protein